jgi:hypothetical protein
LTTVFAVVAFSLTKERGKIINEVRFYPQPGKYWKIGLCRMFRKQVRELIWVYFSISLSGLLLHIRTHTETFSI